MFKKARHRSSEYTDASSPSHNSLSFVSRFIESLYETLSQNVLYLIMAVVGISFLAMLALRIHLITAYIPELGGIESNVIYSLQRILDGYPLYVDPATAPYSITQYTPLYYYLCWLVGKLFQVDAANVHQVYILCRTVSLVLNLLFAGTAFFILHNIFRVRKALSFVAFAYAFVYLDEESFSRPDSLYSLLVLVSIGLFLKMLIQKEQRPSQFYLISASVVSITAIFAKQSAIYLPMLLLFFLLFYVRNIRWTLAALLSMGGAFSLLFLMSGGGDVHAFLQNTVQGVNNGASLAWFAKRIMIEHFQKERIINILGLFIGTYYLAKGKADTLKFLGLCILGSFAFALVTSVKIGAAPNYFTEFIVLTVIGAIVFVTNNDALFRKPYLIKETWGSSYKPLFYLLLVIFTLPPRFAGKFQKKVVEVYQVGEKGYTEELAVVDYLYKEGHLQSSDQVLVTTHVQDYLNKFLYKNVIFPQKEIVKANPPGVYDYSLFKQGLRQGTVKYIVASLSEGHVDTLAQDMAISYDLVDADFSSYKPVTQLGDYVIFEHQNRISTASNPNKH